MKNILNLFVRSFAVVGFIVIATSMTGWILLLTREKPHLPDSIILSLDFTKDVPEKTEDNPITMAMGHNGEMNLQDMLSTLNMAARDPRVKMVVAGFRENTISMAGTQELREAIYRLRDEGKLSFAFATSFGEFGPADKAYYLASAFEEVWLQPMGLVGITGLSAQSPFIREALEKIGAKADFVHREEYKSAMDMLTEDDFTAANAEMLGSILDDLTMQMVGDIAEERELEPFKLMQLMDDAPITADKALQEKLITHMGYEDELVDQLAEISDENTQTIDAQDYLQMRHAEINGHVDEGDVKQEPRPVIALIEASGEIVQSADGVAKSNLLAADEMASAIDDAVNDKKVEAILLRIDSPGGSAVASETIRRAIERAQKAGLPVVASMGEMAGSGGYWIAAQADAILADRSTLTGSIGVIAGKITGTDELWDKLGIHWSMITRGENADLLTVTAPFTDAQHAKIDALVGDTYQAFKAHVANARDLSDEEVAAVAKGRVWTGNQAVNNGLVDELGGFYDAIQYTKNLIGLTEDDSVFLNSFPAPESLPKRIAKILQQFGGLGVSMTKLNSMIHAIEPVLSPLLTMSSPKMGEVRMMGVGVR